MPVSYTHLDVYKRQAQAMEAYFQEHLPGAQVRVEDALQHVGRAVNALCCDGYKFSAKHAPQILSLIHIWPVANNCLQDSFS